MVEKLQNKAKKPKIIIADDDNRQVPQPQKTPKHIPLGDPKTGQFVKIHPDRPKPPKQPTLPRLRDAKGRFVSRRQSEPVVQQSPIQIRENQKAQKPIRRPPPAPQQQPKYDYPFHFDDDIFQTENESQKNSKSLTYVTVKIRNSNLL